MQWNRREFLKFMSVGSAQAALALSQVGCDKFQPTVDALQPLGLPFKPLTPTATDSVVLAEGFESRLLIKRGDPMGGSLFFGDHADYTCLFPINANEALLWVNHEYLNPIFVSGWNGSNKRTKEQVVKEMGYVGGSILKIKRKSQSDFWEVATGSPSNRRFDASTPIPFSAGIQIDGTNLSLGTLANCAGGKTPWNTLLTCEENYDMFFGEVVNWKDRSQPIFQPSYGFFWADFVKRSPLHYGWVVEINPFTGQAKKLVSLGRFRHESATTVKTPDGRAVVYMADDRTDECLYKFVADKKNTLDSGTLYVANFEAGKWIPLVWEKSNILKKHFKGQLEVLIRTPEAGKLVGGTPLERPEDIEVDPRDGSIYVALTGVNSRQTLGKIVKISEQAAKYDSLLFKQQTFLTGGPDGFANPDNLAFDIKGNLWMTSDISGSRMGKGVHKPFQNNGLFYIPLQGKQAGKVFQVGSAPTDAEFTGPCFSADGNTLFVSIQHPGERSRSIEKMTSHWPEGGKSHPKSSVIMLAGAAMRKLMS